MLEAFQVADKIEACNKAIEKRCAELAEVGKEKVLSEVEYDKEYEVERWPREHWQETGLHCD